MVAAHRRRRHVGLHVALKRGAPAASAALALAIVALLPRRARAPRRAGAGVSCDRRRSSRRAPRRRRLGRGDASTHRAADAGAATADARAVFDPPRALTDTQALYPADAPPINEPVSVTVKLRIDTTGAVTKVDLVTPPAPPFDEAVMTAARGFRFEPGRYGGKPVPVEITFTQKFLPRARPPTPGAPNAPETPAGPPLTAVLRGRLVELGTRRPIAAAAVVAVVGDQPYRTESDARGHFRLPLPPGAARVSVFGSEHHAFVQQETIATGQELAVTYLIERERYNLNETVVVAERRREEVSRITLRGAEIQKIPGTFGDPFRVIQTLPGVASVVSLLPFPIVRGASPSSTGFLLDGTRVPLLFHLLAGPSVVHPEFIDEIQFFPGGAPAPYGGYVGGIVDGRTRRARPDERLLDFDVNLLQAGASSARRFPPLGATVTAAGRYGYPGYLLGLATNEVSLSYWDYQLRLDGGNPRTAGRSSSSARATNSTRRAHGDAERSEPAAQAVADPRLSPPGPAPPPTQGRLARRPAPCSATTARSSNGTDFWVWTAEPQLAATWTQSNAADRRRRLGTFRSLRQGGDGAADREPVRRDPSSLGTIYVGSSYLEALWRPTPDAARSGPACAPTSTRTRRPRRPPSIRASPVRYRLLEREPARDGPTATTRAVWLKGSAGIYHQPPRFVLPLPGLDLMPLRYGLLRSYQTSLGTEIPLRERPRSRSRATSTTWTRRSSICRSTRRR